MADNRVEAWLRLRDARRFQSDARGSAAALRSVGDAGGHVSRASGAVNKGLGGVGAVLGTIGAAARSAAYGIGAAGGAAAILGLKFNTSMEQNQVAFTHFLGSADEAEKYLDRLYKLAATTPFEFQDLTTGAKRMMAFGSSADSAYKQLKTIGDAASGLGTGTEGINRMVTALGQMQVAGVVQGDELRQFQEAGINVYKYMIKAGLITKDDIGQIGQMHIDSTKAISAIMAGMQKDFGGMSKEQGKTMAGQLSTMKDYASQAAGALTKPLFDLLKSDVLPRINKTMQKVAAWARGGGVDRFIDKVKQAGTAFQTAFKFGGGSAQGFTGGAGIAAKVGGIIHDIVPILKDAFKIGKDVVMQFIDAIKPMQPFFENILLPLLKGFAKGVLGSIILAFKVAIPLIKLVATVLGWLGEKAKPLKPVFEGIGMVIGMLIGGPFLKLFGFLPKIGGLFKLLGGFVSFTSKAVGWTVKAFARLIGVGFKIIAWLFKMSPQVRIVTAIFKTMGSVVGRVAGWIVGKLEKLVGFIGRMPGKIGAAARGMWDGLKSAFAAAWNFIASKWNNLSLGFTLPGVLKKLPGPDHVSIGTPDLPLLAKGGIVSGSGSWITGERGPELNTLAGGRVSVQPLPALGASSAPTLPMPNMTRTIRVPVYLGRRQIAEAVAEDAADEVARS